MLCTVTLFLTYLVRLLQVVAGDAGDEVQREYEIHIRQIGVEVYHIASGHIIVAGFKVCSFAPKHKPLGHDKGS